MTKEGVQVEINEEVDAPCLASFARHGNSEAGATGNLVQFLIAT
jgi:hypothetical protein